MTWIGDKLTDFSQQIGQKISEGQAYVGDKFNQGKEFLKKHRGAIAGITSLVGIGGMALAKLLTQNGGNGIPQPPAGSWASGLPSVPQD